MGINYNPKIVTDGLVLCLDAANPKSYPGIGTTWYDISGNSYNATLINSPTHNNSVGYISFNGINQYATHVLPYFSSGTIDFTFELIFKVRTLPTANYGPNGHIWGGQNENNIVSYINPAIGLESKLNLVYDDSRYLGAGHNSNSSITADEWVHWVAQGKFSDGTIAHYFNGKLDKDFTATVTGQESRSRGSGFIAYDTRWLTYTELDIAIIREYHRILSAAEIKQNFNALRGRYGI